MKLLRAVSSTIVVSLALGAGCARPHCGAGTIEQQAPDGSLTCVPVDQAGAETPCDDADGGTAVISGGVCVGRVHCDPATTTYDPVTGTCVANSGAPSCACA